jgi:hypothetical protein
MSRRLTRQFRVFSLGILVLAIFFFVFFDRSKHAPLLEVVNPFNVDPYDAVGSFGILLGLFTALLTGLRAFRPYAGGETSPEGLESILRGATVVLLSIAVTLVADAIAVLREPSEPLGSPGGRTLISLVAVLAIMDVCAGLWLRARLQDVPRSDGGRPWWRPVFICLVSAIILAAYPPAWDTSIVGGILTALLGMLVLFAAVWALVTMMFPAPGPAGEDAIDDIAAIYRCLKGRRGIPAGVFNGMERITQAPAVQGLIGWLNPRLHPWHAAALGGAALGLALAAAEALGEGVSPQAGRFLLAGAVFIVIASAGVLVGYGLLGRFLGLYRPPKPVAAT